ncbi:MAG: lytic transglycosylase domain-containing protein [Bradymonadia bacterium]
MCVTKTDPPQITNDPRICRKGATQLFGRKRRRKARRYPLSTDFHLKKWAPKSSTKSRARAKRYANLVTSSAQRFEIPEALLWAVMRIESNFIPTAVSHKGAIGLMQLMPATAKDLGVADPYDPEQNIWGAAKLLRQLADRFNGDTVKVLAAYHAGGGAVNKAGGIPYPQTREYVEKVLCAYDAYQKLNPTGS